MARKAGGKTTVNIKGVRYRGPGYVAPIRESLGVSLEDLQPGQCRWPVTMDKPYGFCGKDVVRGKSYCEQHFELSRQPIQSDDSSLEDGL